MDELFNSLLARCEIIYRDDGKMTVAFRHKSFAEFFYAKYLSNEGRLDVSDKSFDLYWGNIAFFYVGLKQDCPELLSELINYDADNDRTKILKLINLGNFLLAGYASPYETISAGVDKIFEEAANYYIDVYKNHTSPILSKFTPMALLCVLRHIMYDGYSYEFFRDAIYNSIADTYCDNDDGEKKAFKLFLLNIAYIEAGGKSQLQTLVDKIGDNLPLPVLLALKHEVTDLKINEFIPTMKRLEKKLRRSAEGNRALRNAIDDLYDKPITSLRIT